MYLHLFVLAIIVVSLVIKCALLCKLIPLGFHARIMHLSWMLIIGFLASSLLGDIAWGIKLLRTFDPLYISSATELFFIRLAYAMVTIKFQCFSLFISSLITSNFKLLPKQLLAAIVTLTIPLYFLYTAFFHTHQIQQYSESMFDLAIGYAPFEIIVMKYVTVSAIFYFLIPALFSLCKKLRNSNTPKILRSQFRILIIFFLLPYLLITMIQAIQLLCSFKTFGEHGHILTGFSSLFFILAITYCIKKILQMRFLNITHYILTAPLNATMEEFKVVLEQLSHATTLQELGHITQTFFKDRFRIALHATSLHFRLAQPLPQTDFRHQAVEQFLSIDNSPIHKLLHTFKIVLFEDLEFENFYQETADKTAILTFLTNIESDIFIPIFSQQKIIAYIKVMQHARSRECFSKTEQTEMIIFANYLGSTINLIQSRNLEIIIKREQSLKRELFAYKQEVDQCNECIRSFIKTDKLHISGGIITYKNRRFSFANDGARQIIDIDINTQHGHELSQAMRNLVQLVETYHTPQTSLVYNTNGDLIFIRATPHLDNNSILIGVRYPNIPDLIGNQTDQLRNPTQWNFLLYLKTTRVGKLIDNFIPGSSDTFLNFKINLLQAALHNNPLLMVTLNADAVAIIELIHAISGRKTLHKITLDYSVEGYDLAILLFGTNKNKNLTDTPLLTRLSDTGTLFIQNIEHTDHLTQEHLAEYIETGLFKEIHGDTKTPSNVRILCSTEMHLDQLLRDGRMVPQLHRILQRNILICPLIAELSALELSTLIDDYCNVINKTHAFNNILKLSEREKRKLATHRPESFYKLREITKQILIEKSKEHEIYNETVFQPSYNTTDQEIIEATRLGKHALRDRKIMTTLWNKFNNQNTIATLLGVNRSSVNRRVKEYNLSFQTKAPTHEADRV